MTEAEVAAAVEIVDQYIAAAGGGDFRPMTPQERACLEVLAAWNAHCRQVKAGPVVH
jgi:hypothetical protein